MNDDVKQLDRELRIMLLHVLKKGYFSQDDLNMLSGKIGFNPITIEIIDSREQVKSK